MKTGAKAMRERIYQMITQSPCSVEYLADVLGEPPALIKAELIRLQRQGQITIETKVVCYVVEPAEDSKGAPC